VPAFSSSWDAEKEGHIGLSFILGKMIKNANDVAFVKNISLRKGEK